MQESSKKMFLKFILLLLVDPNKKVKSYRESLDCANLKCRGGKTLLLRHRRISEHKIFPGLFLNGKVRKSPVQLYNNPDMIQIDLLQSIFI